MAKRLTVIISQSSMRHSQAAEAEERLLTELMMAAGMDATLVGSLDSVQVDSTDYLCLSAASNQTLALVSSLSFEQVSQQWERLQLGGQVVRLGQTGRVGQRRVIYFPLSSNTAATLEDLSQLLFDQAVKTVEVIMPLGKNNRVRPSDVPLASSPARPAAGKPSDSESSSSSPAPSQPPLPLPAHASVNRRSEAQAELDEEWPDLDRLVDDLDACDL